MFDESAFNNDIINNREIVKHNENSRIKVVSKRSINSNNNNNEEPNWWDRFKRSVQSFFGYDSDEQHEIVVENHIDDKKLTQEILPPQHQPAPLTLVNGHDTSEMQRRKRERDDDDEDEDDDDNEIGSGDHTHDTHWENSTPENEDDRENGNEVEIIKSLPDILDSKYCKSCVVFLSENVA